MLQLNTGTHRTVFTKTKNPKNKRNPARNKPVRANVTFLTVLYLLQKDEKTPVPSSSMPFFMGIKTRFSS